VNRDLESSDSSEGHPFSESVVKLFYLSLYTLFRKVQNWDTRSLHFEYESLLCLRGGIILVELLGKSISCIIKDLEPVSTAILSPSSHDPPTPHSPFAVSLPPISTITYHRSLSSPISSGIQNPVHNFHISYENSEAKCNIPRRLLPPTTPKRSASPFRLVPKNSMTYNVIHIFDAVARFGSMVAPLAALPLHIAVLVLFAGLSLCWRGQGRE
jgi:hypothetical protein